MTPDETIAEWLPLFPEAPPETSMFDSSVHTWTHPGQGLPNHLVCEPGGCHAARSCPRVDLAIGELDLEDDTAPQMTAYGAHRRALEQGERFGVIAENSYLAREAAFQVETGIGPYPRDAHDPKPNTPAPVRPVRERTPAR